MKSRPSIGWANVGNEGYGQSNVWRDDNPYDIAIVDAEDARFELFLHGVLVIMR